MQELERKATQKDEEKLAKKHYDEQEAARVRQQQEQSKT
jgi:hypothetical protein